MKIIPICLSAIVSVSFLILLLYPEVGLYEKFAVGVSILYTSVLVLAVSLSQGLIREERLENRIYREMMRERMEALDGQMSLLQQATADARQGARDIRRLGVEVVRKVPPVTIPHFRHFLAEFVKTADSHSVCRCCGANIENQEQHAPDCPVSILAYAYQGLERLKERYPELDRQSPADRIVQGLLDR